MWLYSDPLELQQLERKRKKKCELPSDRKTSPHLIYILQIQWCFIKISTLRLKKNNFKLKKWVCFSGSAIKNNVNSLEINHENIPNRVITIFVTLSLFDPEWKFGKMLTEDIDTKKNKPVVTDAACLQWDVFLHLCYHQICIYVYALE